MLTPEQHLKFINQLIFTLLDVSIQPYFSLQVYESDDLPTRICMNCEEKMVMFQLFVLECYKVQETLQKMCGEKNEDLQIKCEISTNIIEDSVIKSEVNLFQFLSIK